MSFTERHSEMRQLLGKQVRVWVNYRKGESAEGKLVHLTNDGTFRLVRGGNLYVGKPALAMEDLDG